MLDQIVHLDPPSDLPFFVFSRVSRFSRLPRSCKMQSKPPLRHSYTTAATATATPAPTTTTTTPVTASVSTSTAAVLWLILLLLLHNLDDLLRYTKIFDL
ncbi:hypothetical protein N7492_005324 [Penicillium capsulatum]|uniref:Uncharacterized protein n=1 Tax=Penicillium capsulatum TaxID=69766 RepID=A0A9W9I9K6_9EURO|nr:hypothetical protein N7492_005324 [Penicillium capsulatum]